MSLVADPEATASPEASPEAAPPAAVLCVDDEPNILSALKRTLRSDGLRVLTAGSGREALDIMAREPIDIVVSDMRMPSMDGAELLEQVHARWPASIRLLLTGHADTSAAVAAINRGRIFRYLTKPWDDTELRATIRQGLEIAAIELRQSAIEVERLGQQ